MRRFFYFCLLIASPALADQTADFLAARDAFRAGDAAKLERSAQRLKNTPLEVYASYYRLRLGLEKADAGAVKDFLSRPEDTPMIDRLRGEWLKALGRKQQWELFDAEYPRLLGEDAELTCYALQSRRRSQEQEALSEARRLWFNGKGLPDSCGPLFEAALAAGIIGEPDVWQRLRLALEAGNVSLAKQLTARLSGNYAVSSAALEVAATDAERYLERPALDRKNGDGQRVVALFALHRLAKQSPDLAVARWEKIASHFPDAERHYFYGWLAYEAARKLDKRATQWFKAAADTPLNEQQSAWRVRAALRAQDWPEVLAAIDAMGETQQSEPAWRYWKARALQAMGKPAEAERLFMALGNEYHFYGQLAGEELIGAPVAARTTAYKPHRQDIAAMQSLPGIQRTLALYRLDMRSEALKEWNWAIRNFNDQELLTAAEIARRNEMYDRAIGAADRTVNMHDFSLRYLAPYREVLHAHIQEHGLEEAWVYGLMRQESRFATTAKSEVGAAGLMQIMPATARWVAKKLGLKSYHQSLIHQIDTNLRLGTYYMKTVLSWFDDSPVLASAAYNAGPGRARLWRGDQALEGAIYAESIPFDETRDYVKKVMSNTMYYARQFDAPQRPLKQRLGIVAGKTADNQQAIPDEK
ncbi:transglycosylase SLT domain-containing protein [Candidatus Ferrigenium straubiae]|jgi:soluble lytic murein transglycosylase|uniref:transglycosylase SLT domain-containing protein n=1 Tax=Candidatus Ferrigenium straubiae TaxID=2919506 RepID=UPI003F4A9DAE